MCTQIIHHSILTHFDALGHYNTTLSQNVPCIRHGNTYIIHVITGFKWYIRPKDLVRMAGRIKLYVNEMDRGRGRMHWFILFRLGTIRVLQRRITVGAFAESGKAPISFVISVCPSFRIYQRRSHWTDFREIWYWGLLRKHIDKFNIWLSVIVVGDIESSYKHSLRVKCISNSQWGINIKRTYHCFM